MFVPRSPFILAVLIFAPWMSEAKEPIEIINGKVVGVSDGDTLSLLVENIALGSTQEVKVRLYGIDAPEDGQAFGNKAKKLLSDLVYRKPVLVYSFGKDKYERVLGEVMVVGATESANQTMLKSGLAWWYSYYAKDRKDLSALQIQAQQSRVGLWSDPQSIPPWDYRKQKAAEENQKILKERAAALSTTSSGSGAPNSSIKVNGQSSSTSPTGSTAPSSSTDQSQTFYTTKSGNKYHTASCSYLKKSKIAIALDKAKAQGLTPCSKCNPPQ